MNETPAFTSGSGSTPEVAPALRVLRSFLGLIQLASAALIFAPWLAVPLSRQFGFEAPLPEGWVRFMGIGLLIATAVLRLLIPGGRRRYRAERAFAEVASATGGTFQVEKRRVDKSGWGGGPTARWNLQQTPVAMEVVSQSKGSSATRITASFATAKELRLSVLPKNILTGMLTSPKFVALVQSGVKQQTDQLPPEQRERTLREIGIFAGEPVTLGDSELDAKLIVKTNDADLARYVLTGGGVSERMRNLNLKRKAWTLSLFSAEGGTGAQLLLDLPGTETNPEVLAAATELFEALLSSLSRNGVLDAGRKPRAVAR